MKEDWRRNHCQPSSEDILLSWDLDTDFWAGFLMIKSSSSKFRSSLSFFAVDAFFLIMLVELSFLLQVFILHHLVWFLCYWLCIVHSQYWIHRPFNYPQSCSFGTPYYAYLEDTCRKILQVIILLLILTKIYETTLFSFGQLSPSWAANFISVR